MDIILFGKQGSGKGTQGKFLAEKYGLRIFEMGAQLREIIAGGSELGMTIKSIVDSGNLVDDDTIMQVVGSFLSSMSPEQRVLFDGIPRTMSQSEKLMNLLKENNRDAFALFINISEEEAIKRLTLRRICKECKGIYGSSYKSNICQYCGGELIMRDDDTLESIKKRLENYQKETVPVIESFYGRDRLIEVDGEQEIKKVTKEMIDKADYLF